MWSFISVFKCVPVFFLPLSFPWCSKSNLVMTAPQFQTLSVLLQSLLSPCSHLGAGSCTQQGQMQCIVCKYLQCNFSFCFCLIITLVIFKNFGPTHTILDFMCSFIFINNCCVLTLALLWHVLCFLFGDYHWFTIKFCYIWYVNRE